MNTTQVSSTGQTNHLTIPLIEESKDTIVSKLLDASTEFSTIKERCTSQRIDFKLLTHAITQRLAVKAKQDGEVVDSINLFLITTVNLIKSQNSEPYNIIKAATTQRMAASMTQELVDKVTQNNYINVFPQQRLNDMWRTASDLAEKGMDYCLNQIKAGNHDSTLIEEYNNCFNIFKEAESHLHSSNKTHTYYEGTNSYLKTEQQRAQATMTHYDNQRLILNSILQLTTEIKTKKDNTCTVADVKKLQAELDTCFKKIQQSDYTLSTHQDSIQL